MRGLSEVGVSPDGLDGVILTCSQPDRAGAAKEALERSPEAEVVIGEPGARYLARIGSKGMRESEKAFGGNVARRFGHVEDVPKDDIVPVKDGETLRVAGLELEAVHTSGHTPDHFSWLGEGLLFAGQATAMRFPDLPALIPPYSLPNYDVTRVLNSIERLRGLDPERLFVSRYGEIPGEPEDYLDGSAEAVRSWRELVEELHGDGSSMNDMVWEFRRRLVDGVSVEVSELDDGFSELYLPTVLGMVLKGYMRNVLHTLPW